MNYNTKKRSLVLFLLGGLVFCKISFSNVCPNPQQLQVILKHAGIESMYDDYLMGLKVLHYKYHHFQYDNRSYNIEFRVNLDKYDIANDKTFVSAGIDTYYKMVYDGDAELYINDKLTNDPSGNFQYTLLDSDFNSDKICNCTYRHKQQIYYKGKFYDFREFIVVLKMSFVDNYNKTKDILEDHIRLTNTEIPKLVIEYMEGSKKDIIVDAILADSFLGTAKLKDYGNGYIDPYGSEERGTKAKIASIIADYSVR